MVAIADCGHPKNHKIMKVVCEDCEKYVLKSFAREKLKSIYDEVAKYDNVVTRSQLCMDLIEQEMEKLK